MVQHPQVEQFVDYDLLAEVGADRCQSSGRVLQRPLVGLAVDLLAPQGCWLTIGVVVLAQSIERRSLPSQLARSEISLIPSVLRCPIPIAGCRILPSSTQFRRTATNLVD